jgi:hypothetical protein
MVSFEDRIGKGTQDRPFSHPMLLSKTELIEGEKDYVKMNTREAGKITDLYWFIFW